MTQLGDPPAPPDAPPLDGPRLAQSIRLLDHLVEHGPATRSELASATGLGRSAIAGITARLLDAGILAEETDASPDGRAMPLALAAGHHVLVTTEVGPDEVIATLAALDGTELARFVEPLDAGAAPAALLDLLAAVLQRAIAAADRRGAPVADLTVLVDGAVAGRPAVVVEGARLGDEPIDVLAELRARVSELAEVEAALPAPVQLLPSAIAAASSEAEALGVADLLYLEGDPALASAIIVDGRPLRGAHGLAASIAHLPIVPNGVRCDCGQVGCLVTVAGPAHVIERAGLADLEAMHGRRAAIDELIARIDAADDRARWSWLDAALWIGRTLQVVVPALDPTVIVIGGYWGGFIPDIDAAFRRNRPTIAGGAIGSIPRIVRASAGPEAALDGARRRARARLVAEPLRLIG
ncbi:ROK family protein [Agromyces sp. CFH 90414]|uniref:ROK family protein n=1 Tax=Agromyces agglutinans TaxID=2662258 RepID=A0A6I2F629_9MICO|nr:ROK family transcriptional regulator [Agromyces agglutinans]MRG59751.1 ROK family protein [Agromyces agglutinans]